MTADGSRPPRLVARRGRARYGRAVSGELPMAQGTDSTTHFGFTDVPLADKQAMVDGVFRSVAHRYDLMNDLMSGGLHRAWKNTLITELNPPRSNRSFALLDMAGGTGDVAVRAAKIAGRGFHATVCDI